MGAKRNTSIPLTVRGSNDRVMLATLAVIELFAVD